MSVVLLSGASGFLGVHTTTRLLEVGHSVRALVRSPDRLWRNLQPLGIERDDSRVEVAHGDMTDAAAVRDAADGCELAVHAAATYSYKRSDVDRMRTENALGTQTVLDAAIDAGCRGIVHVSSTAALITKDAVLSEQSPLGVGIGPYTTSKIESERVARQRQDAGAPVAIVNPGAILGPHDPYLGESNQVVRDVLRGRLPTWPRGGMQWVDVRDTAEVIVVALERPGRRFMVPGANLHDPHGPLSAATGRRLPVLTLPLAMVVPALYPGYATGWSFLPGAVEGVRFIALGTSVDASTTVAELGIPGRDFQVTLRDTIRWMVEAGHLSPKQAGRSLADA